MLSHRARLRTIAGIESHLTATCLCVIEADFDAQPPQGRDHCFTDIGKHLVDQTGDKKRDTHKIVAQTSVRNFETSSHRLKETLIKLVALPVSPPFGRG